MPTKKTNKASVKKAVAKSPVIEKVCNCGPECKCHKHGAAHWVKHVIVWAIIFALGMAAGQFLPCGHHKKMQHKHPVFVKGCVDMESIQCPKMKEKLLAADVNGDECISFEEYRAWRQANKPMKKGKFAKKPMKPMEPAPEAPAPQAPVAE